MVNPLVLAKALTRVEKLIKHVKATKIPGRTIDAWGAYNGCVTRSCRVSEVLQALNAVFRGVPYKGLYRMPCNSKV